MRSYLVEADVNFEGRTASASMGSLSWVFAGRQSYMYNFHMRWAKLREDEYILN